MSLEEGGPSWELDSCCQVSVKPCRNGFLDWPHVAVVDLSGLPHVYILCLICVCLMKDVNFNEF